MKTATLILSALFILVQSYSQDSISLKKSDYTVSMHKIILGSMNGYEFEGKISKKSTLSIGAGMGIGVLNNNEQIALIPAVSSSYKYYYNINKRIKQKKDIANNCANFLVVGADIYFPKSLGYSNNWMISQGWGIQRKLFKNAFFNLQIGISENIYKNNSIVEIAIDPLLKGLIIFKL